MKNNIIFDSRVASAKNYVIGGGLEFVVGFPVAVWGVVHPGFEMTA